MIVAWSAACISHAIIRYAPRPIWKESRICQSQLTNRPVGTVSRGVAPVRAYRRIFVVLNVAPRPKG